MLLARAYTATIYSVAMKRCGKRNVVRRPLEITWEHLSLADDCYIGPGCRIEGVSLHNGIPYFPSIELGNRVSVEQRCTIVAAAALKIGSDTTISYDVMITDLDHDYENLAVHVLRQPLRVKSTSIGDTCFLGAGSKILAGTSLGRQCIVGANSVVRGEYPDFCVLTGNPARIVKRYDPVRRLWRPTDTAGAFSE